MIIISEPTYEDIFNYIDSNFQELSGRLIILDKTVRHLKELFLNLSSYIQNYLNKYTKEVKKKYEVQK